MNRSEFDPDQPGDGHPKVWSVVRLNLDRAELLNAENADAYIKVVRVFQSRADAIADAERLNVLNQSKGVYYFVSKSNWNKPTVETDSSTPDTE